MLSSNCHQGTSKGRRTIITMGEVNGMIEHHTAMGPLGFSMHATPA